MKAIIANPPGGRALINDHINMISRLRGIRKAVPCWQIADWIRKGVFSLELAKGNRVGWDFEDHNLGLADYTAWYEDQQRQRDERRARAEDSRVRGPQAVDEGIAGAAHKALSRSDESEWSQPPGSGAGEEPPPPAPPRVERGSSSPAPGPKQVRPKPEDVLKI